MNTSGLGSLRLWTWRRHGEETIRAREEANPLNRIEAQGQAAAFEEMAKYLDVVQQAREEHGDA